MVANSLTHCQSFNRRSDTGGGSAVTGRYQRQAPSRPLKATELVSLDPAHWIIVWQDNPAEVVVRAPGATRGPEGREQRGQAAERAWAGSAHTHTHTQVTKVPFQHSPALDGWRDDG